MRDLATEGTIFPVLVFPNPVGEKASLSYYVECISVYENWYIPELNTIFLICVLSQKEHKSPLVELTFPLPLQGSFIELFFVCSVCL